MLISQWLGEKPMHLMIYPQAHLVFSSWVYTINPDALKQIWNPYPSTEDRLFLTKHNTGLQLPHSWLSWIPDRLLKRDVSSSLTRSQVLWG